MAYSLKVIEPLAPLQTTYANKEEVPYYVDFEPNYTSSENMQFTAMVPLPIIDDLIENGIGAVASHVRSRSIYARV